MRKLVVAMITYKLNSTHFISLHIILVKDWPDQLEYDEQAMKMNITYFITSIDWRFISDEIMCFVTEKLVMARIERNAKTVPYLSNTQFVVLVNLMVLYFNMRDILYMSEKYVLLSNS